MWITLLAHRFIHLAIATVAVALLATAVSAQQAATYEVVSSFTMAEGRPYGVIQARNAQLYGTMVAPPSIFTTRRRGTTVFVMDAAGVFVVSTTGALTTLHDFTLSDGANPSSELIEASDGTLYCAAQMGGPDDGGVIFRIRLATSTPGQYFELVSRNSATCLDVFGAATDAAASVIQWVCHGGENQLPSRVTNRAAPARDIQWVTTYCASGQSACPAGSVLCQSGERAGVVQPILCKPP